MTVEAAVLYPYMLLIAFLLVKVTIYQYASVKEQASILYDSVFTENRMETSDVLRLADTAFEFMSQ